MKILNYNKTREVSIANAVSGTIQHCGADGAIESAREIAENAAKTIGDIVARLHEKGALSDADIIDLVGYPFTVTE